ncbi:MAG: hypothetical protein J7K96_08310 [Desulfobacteraceae bacterium]|nr:hypothetical protein [Desulfobacteraceae bacterium]
MKKSVLFVLLVLMILLPSQAFSWTWTPFQLSLWEPVQLFPEKFDVYGMRLNLAYGRNQNLTGLDIGGVNVVAQSQTGGQLGLINLSGDSLGGCAGVMNYANRYRGVQFGLLNTAQNFVSGLQAGGLMNLSDHVKGVQVHFGIFGNGAVQVDGAQLVLLAGYNLTDDINGLQMAMFGFNYTTENVHGVQFAMFYNYAKNLNGLQFGLVNACERLSGVQIGLVNVVGKGKMTYMPVMNFNF